MIFKNKKVLIGLFVLFSVIIVVGGILIGVNVEKQRKLREQSKEAPYLTTLGHAGIGVFITGLVGITIISIMLFGQKQNRADIRQNNQDNNSDESPFNNLDSNQSDFDPLMEIVTGQGGSEYIGDADDLGVVTSEKVYPKVRKSKWDELNELRKYNNECQRRRLKENPNLIIENPDLEVFLDNTLK